MRIHRRQLIFYVFTIGFFGFLIHQKNRENPLTIRNRLVNRTFFSNLFSIPIIKNFQATLQTPRYSYLRQKKKKLIAFVSTRGPKMRTKDKSRIRAIIHPFVHRWLYTECLSNKRDRRLIYFSDVHGRRDRLGDGQRTRYLNFIGMHGMSIRNLLYYRFCLIYVLAACTRKSLI